MYTYTHTQTHPHTRIHAHVHTHAHAHARTHTKRSRYLGRQDPWCLSLQHTVTQYNTLQLTATHCDPPKHSVSCCYILQYRSSTSQFWPYGPMFQVTAIRCNQLQHPATHCNIPQQTAARCHTDFKPRHYGRLDPYFPSHSHCHTLQHIHTLLHTAKQI